VRSVHWLLGELNRDFDRQGGQDGGSTRCRVATTTVGWVMERVGLQRTRDPIDRLPLRTRHFHTCCHRGGALGRRETRATLERVEAAYPK